MDKIYKKLFWSGGMLWASLFNAHAAEPKNYIGLNYYTKIPAECQSDADSFIDHDIKKFGVTHVVCNGKNLLWLEKVNFVYSQKLKDDVRQDSTVVDQITLPAVRKNHTVIIASTWDCKTKAKEPSPELVAAIIDEDKGKILTYKNKGLLTLWVLSTPDNKIVQASPAVLKATTCLNADFGSEP